MRQSRILSQGMAPPGERRSSEGIARRHPNHSASGSGMEPELAPAIGQYANLQHSVRPDLLFGTGPWFTIVSNTLPVDRACPSFPTQALGTPNLGPWSNGEALDPMR